MRVLLAPAAFAGTLTAEQAAQALASGWAAAAPRDALDLCPLPEAGPGLLAPRVGQADLVVTGEGSFGPSSLLGGPVGALAALAQEAGVPCVVLAGRVSVGRREAGARGVDEALALVDLVGPERALSEPAAALSALAARAAASWSGR